MHRLVYSNYPQLFLISTHPVGKVAYLHLSYSPELKQEIINQVLLEGRSQLSVSLDYTLPNIGTLSNWLAQYKKNGYAIVEKTRGRSSKMGRKAEKRTIESVLQEGLD